MSYELTTEKVNAHNIDNMMGNLGIVFTQLDAVYAEAIMEVTTKISQSMGLLHGGATIALAESVAGIGTYNLINKDKACVGMQISASHLSSAKIGDTVIAKADLIHKGGRSHVWDVNIYSQNSGKLISSIKVTNAIITKHKERLNDQYHE